MSNFDWVAVALVTIMAAARITRLVVVDVYPPVVWLRMKWDDLTANEEGGDGPWTEMLHCGYCFGFYASVLVVLPGWLSDWHTAWWVVCGTLAVSYLAGIVMAYDGSPND